MVEENCCRQHREHTRTEHDRRIPLAVVSKMPVVQAVLWENVRIDRKFLRYCSLKDPEPNGDAYRSIHFISSPNTHTSWNDQLKRRILRPRFTTVTEGPIYVLVPASFVTTTG